MANGYQQFGKGTAALIQAWLDPLKVAREAAQSEGSRSAVENLYFNQLIYLPKEKALEVIEQMPELQLYPLGKRYARLLIQSGTPQPRPLTKTEESAVERDVSRMLEEAFIKGGVPRFPTTPEGVAKLQEKGEPFAIKGTGGTAELVTVPPDLTKYAMARVRPFLEAGYPIYARPDTGIPSALEMAMDWIEKHPGAIPTKEDITREYGKPGGLAGTPEHTKWNLMEASKHVGAVDFETDIPDEEKPIVKALAHGEEALTTEDRRDLPRWWYALRNNEEFRKLFGKEIEGEIFLTGLDEVPEEKRNSALGFIANLPLSPQSIAYLMQVAEGMQSPWWVSGWRISSKPGEEKTESKGWGWLNAFGLE